MFSKLVNLVRNLDDEIVAGAGIGACIGGGLSALNVLEGTLQLALFPAHMIVRNAQAIAEPFVRIASPVVIMPLYTGLGGAAGWALNEMNGGSGKSYRRRIRQLEDELDAEMEAHLHNEIELQELMDKAGRGGYADL